MAGGWRRGAARSRLLRVLIRDTVRALRDLKDILHFDPEISSAVQEIGAQSSRPNALVLLGTSPSAKARLLHCILGRKLLPEPLPRGCRWVRIQYGSTTQVHLSLGNSEFELVEDLECNKRPWETLPLQDLLRQDQTELSTILEVELNISFLKDGLRIIIPPDIDSDTQDISYHRLKEMHFDLYTKREAILKNVLPIYLYAIDRMGANIFSESITSSVSTVEEDFWSTFNLYYMASGKSGSDSGGKGKKVVDLGGRDVGGATVFSGEIEKINQWHLVNLQTSLISSDIDTQDISYHRLKEIHSDLYTKRAAILKNVLPIYLYAIDRMGANIFSESITSSVSTVDEDFWSTFNLYYMASGKSGSDSGGKGKKVVDLGGRDVGGAAVFSGENCLDLHQAKQLDPHAQFLFILFSNTSPETRPPEAFAGTESTESAGPFRADMLPEADRDLLEGIGPTQESSEQNEIADRRRHEEQMAFMNELLDQWELISNPPSKYHVKSQWVILDDTKALQSAACEGDGETLKRRRERDSDRRAQSRGELLSAALHFAADTAHSHLLDHCTRLSEVHVKLLQHFILASFDMARELQVVPKKIQYVARQEQQLYDKITQMFSEGDKKQELIQIMQEVLQEMKTEVQNMDWSVDDLPCHQDRRFMISNSIFYSQRDSPIVSLDLNSRSGQNHQRLDQFDRSEAVSPVENENESDSDVEEAMSYDSYNFDDYEIIQSNDESLCASECYSRVRSRSEEESLPSALATIHVENESAALSLAPASSLASVCSGVAVCGKQASLDVQQTVLAKLSRKISLKLVKFVDCLKDTYFGTLQRCLESLERSCRLELHARAASEAARQLARAARRVELKALASFSLLRTLLDSLRRFFHKLSIAGGAAEDACCALSPVWRRQVALHTVSSLSPQRLARIISTQILERLSVAHERYQSALGTLENALANRLHHTEDVKLAIRKKYAPSFARLCLESTSMCDLLMYGTPELGREIGRGQYGVVYAVRGSWAGHSPAAVKSVLPADERHYHELAMEFFYTRSIPSHPRIVRLLGSLVQRGGGGAPGVLLVSPRYCRDLHAAVRAGLSFANRMRISCDIVEGIRYLHSLGLVHRDVKMKNVLLDSRDRAALSDLGFCAAEALMSGSIVGTPVHMAPELLCGGYDAAVDVYAFGILFWYVCAGNIKLPSAFEDFQNKEQLWSKVKRGLRPERLPHFTDECWEIMQSCWASEPTQRALLGDVQIKLEKILEQALKDEQTQPYVPKNKDCDDGSDEDTLDMTGIYLSAR